MTQILGLDHLVLTVAHIPATIAFHRAALGLRAEHCTPVGVGAAPICVFCPTRR